MGVAAPVPQTGPCAGESEEHEDDHRNQAAQADILSDRVS